MDANKLNEEIKDLLTIFSDQKIYGEQMVKVKDMDKMNSACPITLVEPKNINIAIELYERRVKLLKMVLTAGFDNISDYNKFKEAEDLVKKHKEKMAKKEQEENGITVEDCPV